MRIAAALFAAGLILTVAFNLTAKAMFAPMMNQAVGNVKALDSTRRGEAAIFREGGEVRRIAPPQRGEQRVTPRGSGGWRARPGDLRAGGWGRPQNPSPQP